MINKFKSDYQNATSIEKLSLLASFFSLSGVSLLTIISAIENINLIQLALGLFSIGLWLLLMSIAYGISNAFFDILDTYEVNIIVIILLKLSFLIIGLGFFVFFLLVGIDYISTFKHS